VDVSCCVEAEVVAGIREGNAGAKVFVSRCKINRGIHPYGLNLGSMVACNVMLVQSLVLLPL